MATLTVVFSVVIAQALHLGDPWWAGISGFMSTQATRPGSLRRGGLRILGTVSGAVVGFAIAPWLAYDHVAGCLLIFCFAFIGGLGISVSPYGYAWLFFGITANMVLLMSLDAPLSALNSAVFRIAEVSVGTLVALLVATVLAPEDPGAATPTAPGWTDLLGRDWPAVLHASRAALAIMLLPLIWSWLDLPSLSQMAITVAAVMAVPSLSGDSNETARVVIQRGSHRLLGCFLGGAAALGLLALSLTDFLPWLAVLGAGVWVCGHVQASTRGVGYVGTQAAIVFIITLVQGWRPPDSILPAIDRFAGMSVGLVILLLVTVLIWPDPETAPGRTLGLASDSAGPRQPHRLHPAGRNNG
jgi:uncharacterized membrane protein YccC